MTQELSIDAFGIRDLSSKLVYLIGVRDVKIRVNAPRSSPVSLTSNLIQRRHSSIHHTDGPCQCVMSTKMGSWLHKASQGLLSVVPKGLDLQLMYEVTPRMRSCLERRSRKHINQYCQVQNRPPKFYETSSKWHKRQSQSEQWSNQQYPHTR